MRFKEGDRVRIKSLDWYNENKDEFGVVLIENGDYMFCKSDTEWCGKIVTIKEICLNEYYRIEEDFGKYRWTDEMIEGLVEEEIITINTASGLQFKELNISLENEMEWNLPQGYQFKDENGNVINATKIVLEKIKKEYPKTYVECCKVLDAEETYLGIGGHKGNLLIRFQRLLICRDAYWKIAGEQMGLDGPWEPDWNNQRPKYTITVIGNQLIKHHSLSQNYILAFPTKEMKDDFSENFKDLIEQCKELL